MTIEEARDVCSTIVSAEINKLCNLYRHHDAQEIEKAKILMLSAFEKRISKKPEHDDCAENIYYCPSCTRWFNGYHKPHHCKCGQALNWERN